MRRAFTVVELLVVVVIIVVLATLSLSGLAVAKNRVRVDKTRSTIRKLNELVLPEYETYQRRRVPLSGATTALGRLVMLRQMMVLEMPDCWGDVRNSFAAVMSGSSHLRTGPVMAYAAAKALGPSAANEGAECLYMIVSRGLSEPDAMEQFRADEIGDRDSDRAFEFVDGWNRPIGFIRWAAGFSAISPAQKADPVNFHDPCDPMRAATNDYALIPVIASAGPDGQAGIDLSTGWLPFTATNLNSIVNTFGRPNGTSWRDNVTNHDLMKK